MKTIEIGWISTFFEKKTKKSFGSSEKSSTFASAIERDALLTRSFAEIAQLVEHNLAKVGVAGPSPVFRSQIEQKERLRMALIIIAQVAELVDAHVSGACAARRAGSSPVLGTLFIQYVKRVGEVAELVDALL